MGKEDGSFRHAAEVTRTEFIVYTEYKMTILLMNCETMENMDPGGQTTSSSCLTGMPGTGIPDPKRI